MTSWIYRFALLTGAVLTSMPAAAQTNILQRCNADILDPAAAEARLHWARRCALTRNVRNPGVWFDTGLPTTSGDMARDYVECAPSTNFDGRNCYSSRADAYEVNGSFVNKLYLSGSLTQDIDADGYYRWSRSVNRKKPRPLYPVFGTLSDLQNASNLQLYPHPTLANCDFYYDKSGTQLATGTGISFYINGFCEAAGPAPLTSGVPLTSLSNNTGSSSFYKLDVPAGATTVVFETRGGTGDVDLFVRRDALPNSTQYDCRPNQRSNDERCYFTVSGPGTWYVQLTGYSNYSGVTLTGTWNALLDEVPVSNLAGAQNSEQVWTLDVPAGRSNVTFSIAGMAGTTGDADLYVRYGSAPTTTVFDCRPYIGGNNEMCTLNNPAAGTWYVMVRGWSQYTGVSLTGNH